MKLFKSKSGEIKELQPENTVEEKPEQKYGPPDKLPEIKRTPQTPPATSAPNRIPRSAAPRISPESSKSPPLFIKVDKYRSIIKNIRDLKSHLLNLGDALDVLEDMQKELANGVQVANKTLDEVNSLISSLDSFFLKPKSMQSDMEEETLPQPGMGQIQSQSDSYTRDMQGQVEKLRAQLRAIG